MVRILTHTHTLRDETAFDDNTTCFCDTCREIPGVASGEVHLIKLCAPATHAHAITVTSSCAARAAIAPTRINIRWVRTGR